MIVTNAGALTSERSPSNLAYGKWKQSHSENSAPDQNFSWPQQMPLPVTVGTETCLSWRSKTRAQLFKAEAAEQGSVLGYGCSRSCSKNNCIFHQSGKHGIDGGQMEDVFAPVGQKVSGKMDWLQPCPQR